MSPKRKFAGLALGASLAISALVVAPSAASPTDDTSQAPQPPEFGPTNLDLFASLDDRGQCLLRSEVYPSGGVGFADSALPYDLLSEFERAYAIVRAELIRNTMDEMAGVSEVRTDSGALGAIVVHALAGAPAYKNGIQPLIDSGRAELRQAYNTLTSIGVRIEVEDSAVVSLTESCEIQDAVSRALIGPVTEAGFETGTDARTGRLHVTVQPGMEEEAAPLLARFGHAVVLDSFAEQVVRAGRADSYTPKRGGSRVASGGSGCSDSFRFNTTALLTAGHCGSQTTASTWVSPNGSQYAGTTDSWNFFAAGFDIRLLYGATYSNAIWTGDSVGSGVLTGTGYTGLGSVNVGDYYLHSGGYWGQATLQITELAGPTKCFKDSMGTTCYLYSANGYGTDSACRAGDSGSPWGLYNGSNGTLTALAVHTVGSLYAGPQPRPCRGTSIQHLIVALGGGSVG